MVASRRGVRLVHACERNGACRDSPESDAGSAPQRREPSVREDLTRIIVDRSGSWRAARSGNWPGRSLATKVTLGGRAIRRAVTRVKPEQALYGASFVKGISISL